MFKDERSYVVNDATNGNERRVLGRDGALKIIPFDDWQLTQWRAPGELRTLLFVLLVKRLLRLLEAALFDLVIAELFEVVCNSSFAEGIDEPFGWIVLIPRDRVT